MVRNALPSPVSPFCRSVGVYWLERREKRGREVQPERRRVHLLLGHGELARTHVLVRIELDFLEADDLAVHLHVAVHPLDAVCDFRAFSNSRSAFTCV